MNVDIRAMRSRPATTVGGAVAIGAVAVAFALLIVLHLLQPELSPATSVVSQYALGAGGWIMAVVFAALGASCLATAAALRVQVRSGAGVAGLVLLVVAAIGLVLAAIFPLGGFMHEVASALGNLGLPIGAALTGHAIAPHAGTRRRLLIALSHAPWVAVVAMMATLFLAPAAVGWFNRLAVLSYGVWMIAAVTITRRQPSDRMHNARSGDRGQPVRSG